MCAPASRPSPPDPPIPASPRPWDARGRGWGEETPALSCSGQEPVERVWGGSGAFPHRGDPSCLRAIGDQAPEGAPDLRQRFLGEKQARVLAVTQDPTWRATCSRAGAASTTASPGDERTPRSQLFCAPPALPGSAPGPFLGRAPSHAPRGVLWQACARPGFVVPLKQAARRCSCGLCRLREERVSSRLLRVGRDHP